MIPIDNWLTVLEHATSKAQATFLYRYINKIGPALCRTIIKYCYIRLDRLNAEAFKNKLIQDREDWDLSEEREVDPSEVIERFNPKIIEKLPFFKFEDGNLKQVEKL